MFIRRAHLLLLLSVLIGTAAPGESLAAGSSCTPTPTRLCLGEGRFGVEVAWGASRLPGHPMPLPGTDAGAFWFFSSDNPELAVKILDGRLVNQHFWVFYGGLTSVGFKLTVTDFVTGKSKPYTSAPGIFASQGDTEALAAGASPAPIVVDEFAFSDEPRPESAEAELLADFRFTPPAPGVGQEVTFTDQSAGDPDRWCWSIDNEPGGPSCFSEQPVAHRVFQAEDTYRVRLSVGRSEGPSVVFSDVVKEVPIRGACTFEISPKSAMFEPEGSFGSVLLTASAPGCPWTVESIPAFVDSVTPRSGAGSDTIFFRVQKNDTGDARTGNLVIAGQTFRIVQSERLCIFGVDPAEMTLSRAEQVGTVAVDAPADCVWKARIENGSFISHLDPVLGKGPGVLRFQVDHNPGNAARSGALIISDKTVEVTQLAFDFAVDFFFSPTAPRPQTVMTFFGRPIEAPISWCWTFGDGSEPLGGCAATIPVTTHAYSLDGVYVVTLKVSQNDGTVAEISKRVVVLSGQNLGCDFEISPRSQSFDFGQGEGAITVTTSDLCRWTAGSEAPFVTITDGSSGIGSGTVTYKVDENMGLAARAGVIALGDDRIFLVLQKGKPCVRLDPASATTNPGGGEGTVTVTAPEDCSWEASSNAPSFLRVTSAASHGSGTVRYQVDPNTTGASRSGRLTIGGVDFPVSQDPCVYQGEVEVVDPAGGIDTVHVDTPEGCPWQAVAVDDFIKLPATASGKGPGDFEYCVAANRGAARQGKIAITTGGVDVPQAGFDPALEGCHQDDTTLCLLNGRFEVRAAYRDLFLGSGVGVLKSLSGEAGYVTFFNFLNPASLEVLLKMIDGRTLNQHFWLFYGSLSNVGYVITASDTETGQVRFYCNPTGTFRSVGDTEAFPPPEP